MVMNIEINLDFCITESPFWTSDYSTASTVDSLLSSHAYTNGLYLKSPCSEEFKTGYSEYHKLLYLRETLVGEGVLDVSVSTNDIETLLQTRDNSPLKTKLTNVLDAINTLFLKVLSFKRTDDLSPDFIKRVHEIVGKGVINNAGEYRTMHCKHLGESCVYLEPHLISKALGDLCLNVMTAWKRAKSFKDCIKITASFMSSFLFIHPFSNGNGRTARLLVGWLLGDYCLAPISIFATRKVYLDCIRMSRHNYRIVPSDLARLLLESCEKTNNRVVYCLDLKEYGERMSEASTIANP